MAKKEVKKPTNKRKRTKYPNLDRMMNLRTRTEEVNDVSSYVGKLNKEEKEWLNKFMGEWNNADLDYKKLENNLHNTPDLKKSCTDRNNARNRDIYARAKASGNLMALSDLEVKLLKEEKSMTLTDEIDDLQDATDNCDETPDTTEEH